MAQLRITSQHNLLDHTRTRSTSGRLLTKMALLCLECGEPARITWYTNSGSSGRVQRFSSHALLPLTSERTESAHCGSTLSHTRTTARRRLWSWSYLNQRRDLRTKYLELLELALDDDEWDRLNDLHAVLTHDDVRYLFAVQRYWQRPAKPVHK